jgi:molecular chaperone DnaK
MKKNIIGIDLGTTNSVVAHMKNKEPLIVEIDENRMIKSIVSYVNKDNPIVGEKANNYSVQNPNETIKSIKRKIGTDYTIQIDDEKYTPVDVSADILEYIRIKAEEELGEEIDGAVITVPAYFNDKQRNATRNAGEIAGINVERIINEPTAAAMSYGLLTEDTDGYILVYDLGGGTFDVTILDITYGMYEIKSTSGNNKLGGDDWTKKIAQYVIDQLESEYNISYIRSDPNLYREILGQSEKCKKELLENQNSSVIIPEQISTIDKTLRCEIDRETFQDLTSELLEKTEDPLQTALTDANLDYNDIDTVLLTGGSTRMIQVKELIKDKFGKVPLDTIDPDESVALGAAIQGAILDDKSYDGTIVEDIVLLDVIPLSLGLEVQGGLFEPVIKKNTTIPVKRSREFTTYQDSQTKVNINIYQGEREIADNNILLGNFTLSNIPVARAGRPNIIVDFKVNENGILEVTAYEDSTGKRNKIEIEGSVGLSEDEVRNKKREAEKYSNVDEREKEKIKVQNQCKNDIKNARIVKKRYKLNKKYKNSITELISELEDFVSGKNLDVKNAKSKSSELSMIINEIKNKCDRKR